MNSLDIEQRFDVAPNGYVRRKSRDSWALVDNGNHYRGRFGNAGQIAGDIEHYQVYGMLPSQDLPSW